MAKRSEVVPWKFRCYNGVNEKKKTASKLLRRL